MKLEQLLQIGREQGLRTSQIIDMVENELKDEGITDFYYATEEQIEKACEKVFKIIGGNRTRDIPENYLDVFFSKIEKVIEEDVANFAKEVAKKGGKVANDVKKALDVTNSKEAKEKVNDIKVFGDPDVWVLIAKASSQSQGWMKSTKAMEIPEVGVVLQVSTQQGENVAEALTFIPNAKIEEKEINGKIIRKIISK